MNAPSTTTFTGLVYATRALDDDTVRRARRHAYSIGRVIEHEHHCLFTWGTVALIELPYGVADPESLHAVTEALASIEPFDTDRKDVEDAVDVAGGPIAIGALAFDPTARGALAVPTIAIFDDGSSAYAVVVAERPVMDHLLSGFPFDGSDLAGANGEPEAPDSFSLVSSRPHRDYRDRVAAAVEAIRAGELEKVVLAREVIVTANREFSQRRLIERMRVLHPSCASFAIDGFVGASPELLCRRIGDQAVAHPLAGTVARSGDPEDDERLANELLHSAKDRSEHAFVVDAIVEDFQLLSSEPVVTEGPHILELRNVAHLATMIRATLRANNVDSSYPSALELVGLLHPTPAVGGVPREAALAYIDQFEELDRDRYAGPVGYVRANGDGEWWIGIRSAIIDGITARLMAGVGVVESSDPESELIETQLKFQALLATTVRP